LVVVAHRWGWRRSRSNINEMDDVDKMDLSPIDEKRCLAIIHAKHLRTLSDACLRLGIPPPMAAMHSKKAFTLLKSLSIEDTNKMPHCYRCGLNFTQRNAFFLRISKMKRPSTKLFRRLRKRNDQRSLSSAFSRLERSNSPSLFAVCNGCGAEMKCGRMPMLRKRNVDDTFEESISSLDSTATSVKRIRLVSSSSTPTLSLNSTTPFSRKGATSSECVTPISTGRRRKAASRLQSVLLAENMSDKPKCNSLSEFLDSLKV
uniref:Uncharacterized protein n=1 Tax=Parascaris univalens TaxID=6257 RepID=A0A915C8P2_PARUN